MSTQAVNQFLQKVTEDSQLQQELAVALEGENNPQAVIDLGVKHGYEFTDDEFWAGIQNRQSEFQQKQDAGELNDEELEAVAGGFCTPVSVIFGVAGGAASVGNFLRNRRKK